MDYENCSGITHTIKKGDTLYEISRMHKVPLALLLKANPYIDVFNLQVGDKICVPKKEDADREDIQKQKGAINDRMPRMDGGMPQMDGGAPRMDGGMPQMNDGMPRMDGRTPQMDGGVPRMDGGMPQMDGGVPRMDGGMPQMDGGVPRMDSGMPQMNDGMPQNSRMPQDGGVPQMDGSVPWMNDRVPQIDRVPCMDGASQMDGGRMQMNDRTPQREHVQNREQMDEMVVWSEQAQYGQGNRKKEKCWKKYVVKPGDTMEDILQQMDGDVEDFFEKNEPRKVYLLPGVAYYICRD